MAIVCLGPDKFQLLAFEYLATQFPLSQIE